MGDGLVKKYAVILNGDTEPRHKENVDRAIRTLRREANYDISVVSTQAPKARADQYVAAEETKLQELISGLKSRMDDDDLLVVYVTGHGQSDGEGCVGLPKGCLPFQKLQSQIDQLPYGRRIVVMDNCYSGNGLRLFANPKTSVVTQGSPGETVSCQTFSPFFWSDNVPDDNGDGKVSLQERYAFALIQGQTASLTQFFSPHPLAFSGPTEEKAFPTKDSLPIEVHNGVEFEAQLKRLKPGQLALVDFGADWCVPCAAYEPTFNALSKQYDGQFLMIRAKGIKGGEEGWAKYGIAQFPTVAFIDSQGKVSKVGNLEDPMDSLLLAAIHSESDRIKVLSDRLESPDSAERLRGLKGLQTMNGKSGPALPKVAKLLDDPEEKIREAACEVLKSMGDQSAAAVPDLIRRLEDPTPAVAIAAAEALAAVGPKAKAALPALLRSLGSKKFQEQTLAWEKARGSSKELIEQNVLDWTFEFNLQSAQALSRLDRDDPALPRKLLSLATDPHLPIEARLAALIGLKGFGEKADFLVADLAKLVEESIEKNTAIGNVLAETLRSICTESRPCAEFFTHRFNDSKAPPLVRYLYMQLAKANLQTTTATDAALLRLAKDKKEDPRLRKHAALLLKQKTASHTEAVKSILRELEEVSVFFDSEPSPIKVRPTAKNVAGVSGTFAGRQSGIGGGIDIWLGRQIFSGPELRVRVGGYGMINSSTGQADLELRAGVSGAWALGKETAAIRPVVLLPELGFAHRVEAKQTVFHGSPLGAALQVGINDKWHFEAAARATIDYGEELQVGGESTLHLMRKF